MMRYLKLTLLILIFNLNLTAQIDEDAMFFTETFYFEDAVGNKDTVRISGSHLASGTVSTDLGEVNIASVPFDSVFEVRLVRQQDIGTFELNVPYMYSHAIGRMENPTQGSLCSDGSTGYAFAVQNLYPPFTIQWDTSSYKPGGIYSCKPGSYICNTLAGNFAFTWYEDFETGPGTFDFVCMGLNDSKYTFYPFDGRPDLFGNPVCHDDWRSYITASIMNSNGVRTDTIDVYSYIPDIGGGPCPPFTTSTREREAIPFTLSPNPVNTWLAVSVPSAVRIKSAEVFSVTGEAVAQMNGAVDKLDVSSYSPGIYLLRLTSFEGVISTKRFVKQ